MSGRGALLLPLLLGTAVAVAGEVYLAAVDYEDGAFFIEVDALVDLPEPEVRARLTDYDNLEQLNNSIRMSEVLAHDAAGKYRVRTVIEACVWFYCKRIHQVQNVVEAWDGTITTTVIPELSDFSYGWMRMHLWQQSNGTRVLIRSEVAPDFWIPPLIGPWLIKRKLRSEALETVRNLETAGSDSDVANGAAVAAR